MKRFLRSGIKNPLAPFILLMALIILITIIITNIKTAQVGYAKTAPPRDLLFDPSLPTSFEETPEAPGEPTLEPDLRGLTAAALEDWARGDFSGAEDKFRTILVFRPNNAVALSHLGALLHHRGDYKSAELMFRKQTQFYPGDPNAFLNLATVLAKQNKLSEALAASKQSIALDPGGSAMHLLSLARIYSLANNTKMALDFLRRAAVRLGPELVELSWDPAFDNIRRTQEFQQLIRDAKKKDGDSKP